MRLFIAAFLFVPAIAHAQVNDLCASITPDALAIGASLTWTGDNTGATITDDYVSGSVFANAGVPAVWHAFTTAACADITIDYCGSDAAFDEFWNALLLTCPGSNSFVPTSNYNNAECGNGNATMRFFNLPAGTYYYPVWTQDPGAYGPYSIYVAASDCGGSTAPNDDCATVTPEALAVGGSLTLSGDNTFATSTGDFPAGSPYAGAPVVWHAFTLSECAKVTLSYCGLDPAWTNSFGFVSRDCPASDLVFFSTFNTTDCADGNRTYIFNQLLPGTYYVPVLLDANDNAEGPYDLLLEAEACPSAPTYSDFCSQTAVQPLAVGGSLNLIGDNSTATGTNDFDAGSPYAGAPVVWHAFSLADCAKVTLAYCGLTPAWTNSFGFLARDCPASDLVFFSTYNDTDCGDGNRTYIFNQLEAGTYYVPVLLDPANNAIGPYTLLLEAEACPSTPSFSDFCSQTTVQPLAVGGSLNLIGDNSTATGTNDFDAGSPYAGAPVVWHAFSLADCAKVTLAYCGLAPAWGNSFGFLARDCPASDLVFFSTYNDTDCGDGNRTYIFAQLAAGTYYVPVLLDPANNASGPYSLLLEAEACPSAPSFSDFCNQVQYLPLAVGGSVNLIGDNTGATATGDFDASSPFSGAPVVWHGITLTECANVSVAYCGLAPVWGNTFGFLAQECPVLTPIYFTTFNDTDCGDGNRTYIFNNVQPGDYLIPVVKDEANNAVGPYTLVATASACPAVPPVNDDCVNVTAQVLDVGTTLTFTGDNTNATSTSDFVVGSPFIAAPVVWHAFTTSECIDLILAYCGQDPAWGNTFGFLTTTCPGDVPVYFSTASPSACGDGNMTYYFNDLPSGTYYVPVLRDATNGAIGPYSVTATAENCLFLGTQNLVGAAINIRPNPSDGHLFIDHLPATDLDVRVLDATGRLLYHERWLPANGGTLELSLEGTLAPGAYLIILAGEQVRHEQRFLVR